MSAPAQGKRFSIRVQVAALAGAALLVAAGGYFLLVAPKRAEASDLDDRIAALRDEVEQARARSRVPPFEEVKVQELFQLAKAMPDRPDMRGIILDLNALARDTGIVFQSIAPGAPVGRDSFYALPIAVSFEGDYYSLSDFLFRLRNLVALRDGSLATRGRLFAVSAIEFTQTENFPKIAARLTVDAYVFGVPPGAAPPPAPALAPSEEAPAETPGAETPGTEPAPEQEEPPANAAPSEGGS